LWEIDGLSNKDIKKKRDTIGVFLQNSSITGFSKIYKFKEEIAEKEKG